MTSSVAGNDDERVSDRAHRVLVAELALDVEAEALEPGDAGVQPLLRRLATHAGAWRRRHDEDAGGRVDGERADRAVEVLARRGLVGDDEDVLGRCHGEHLTAPACAAPKRRL